MKTLEQKWKYVDRVIIAAKQMVGIVIVDVLKKDTEGIAKGDALLWNLVVRDGYRQNGLGRRLLREAERIAKDRGCRYVYLEWDLADSPRWVQDWYVREGYEERSFGETSALMRKKL